MRHEGCEEPDCVVCGPNKIMTPQEFKQLAPGSYQSLVQFAGDRYEVRSVIPSLERQEVYSALLSTSPSYKGKKQYPDGRLALFITAAHPNNVSRKTSEWVWEDEL